VYKKSGENNMHSNEERECRKPIELKLQSVMSSYYYYMRER